MSPLQTVGIGGFQVLNLNNKSMFMVRNNAGAVVNDTEYFNCLMGVSSGEVTDVDRAYFVMPAAGTITNFRVKYDAALTGAMAMEYYIVVNGVSTLVATVNSSGSTKFAALNIVLAKGDLVCYKYIPRSSPTSTHHWISCVIESATDMMIMGNNKALHNTSIRYFTPQGSCNALQATNSAARVYFPTSGTLKNIYVRLSQPPGVGNTWQIKIIDQAFATKATINISDLNTTGEAVITYNLVQGNAYYISIDPTVGTPTPCYFSYSSVFQPLIQGEYPLMYTEYANVLDSVNPQYNYLIGPKFYLIASSTPTPTERRMPLLNGYVLKKFYVRSEAAPGAGKSWTYNVGVGYPSTPSGLSVAIMDTNNNNVDNTNEYTTVEGEEYLLKLTPSGSPATTNKVWASMVLAN